MIDIAIITGTRTEPVEGAVAQGEITEPSERIKDIGVHYFCDYDKSHWGFVRITDVPDDAVASDYDIHIVTESHEVVHKESPVMEDFHVATGVLNVQRYEDRKAQEQEEVIE